MQRYIAQLCSSMIIREQFSPPFFSLSLKEMLLEINTLENEVVE